MCSHGRCRCLAMCTCCADTSFALGDYSKHFGSLLDGKTAILEQVPLLVVGRYGRGIYNECRFGVFALFGNNVDILLEMQYSAFVDEAVCQLTGCTVISGNKLAFVEEISYKGAHSNAACSKKIDRFNILEFHYSKFIFYVLISFRCMHLRASVPHRQSHRLHSVCPFFLCSAPDLLSRSHCSLFPVPW